VSEPTEALLLVLIHWAADFFSGMSLPIPGWSKLAEQDNTEFVRALFEAYRKGTNLRSALSQLISNLSGLALIVVVLHVYRYLDMFLVEKSARFSVGALNLTKDPRFRLMSRNASLVSLSVSAVKAGSSRDPVSLNYSAFFKFCVDASAFNALAVQRENELEARLDAMLVELA
jgi:hypothetical protein